MKTIRLIACDIDGVLVEDTFSPVLRNIVLYLGGEYTRELERNVFSRPRKEAKEYFNKIFNRNDTDSDTFFKIREEYINNYGCNVIEGVPEFLKLISSLDVYLVAYGGLSEEYIADEIKKYMYYFDQYICTNDFRPGIKEITKDIYGLEFNQVLFIDDVNTVAEVAKINNVPFIGTPAGFSWSFQREDMISTGVKYILNSVKEIDMELLSRIDHEAACGTIWEKHHIS